MCWAVQLPLLRRRGSLKITNQGQVTGGNRELGAVTGPLSVRERPPRRSGRWSVRLQGGIDGEELRPELQRAVINYALGGAQFHVLALPSLVSAMCTIAAFGAS